MTSGGSPSLLSVFEWHYPGEVTQLACSADGRQVALGGSAGSIECWERDGQQWRRLYTYIAPDRELPPFALSPDGEQCVVASPDGHEISVRSLPSGKQTASLSVQDSRVVVLAYSPHGEVTVGDDRGYIHVLDWTRLGQPHPFTAHYRVSMEAPTERPVKALAWSGDGEVLATSEESDPYVCVYLHRDQAWVRTMPYRKMLAVEAIAWRHDSKRIAVAHGTEVEIRARQSWRKVLVTCVGGHREAVRAVSWSPDGRFVLSLGNCGELCIWDAGTGVLVGRIDGEETAGQESFACSFVVVPGGQVLVGGRNWMARLLNVFDSVGCRIIGEEARESASPLPWSVIFCSQCCTVDDVQEGVTVAHISRIEAGRLVCARCRRFLATGLPSPSGHPLKDFFAITLHELYEELDIDAWTLGGCWISSRGLLRWMQTSEVTAQHAQPARLMIVEGTRPGAVGRIPDHVVVAGLEVDGVPYCLDADGAGPEADFLREWHVVAALDEICLVPADEQRLTAAGIPGNQQASDRIADALHEQFGLWQPSLLPRFMRQGSVGG